jgi:hypothetical protein
MTIIFIFIRDKLRRLETGNLHERRPCGRRRHRWDDIKIDF